MTTQTPDAVREAEEREERIDHLRSEIRRCQIAIDSGTADPWWREDQSRFEHELRQLTEPRPPAALADDLTPRERIARVVAWEHFGIAWHHMEKQSHADVLAMVDRMLDSRAGDAGEGWKLVPIEPTEAMWEAFDHYNGDKRTGYDTWLKAWSAMIAASPAPAVDARNADRDALAGYRAAVSFISADSWDGCSDCMEILKAARAADWQNAQAADLVETARQLARIRQHRPDYAAPAVDEHTSYVEKRLAEGGLRLVSGSPTMLQDEFARYEADRKPAVDAVPAGEKRDSILRQAAQEAYRVCVETRHVSLGDKARDAILAMQSRPPVDAGKDHNGGRCPHCDDTGDVHRIDGEWMGACHCPAGNGSAAVAVPPGWKLVPIKSTEAMQRAFTEAALKGSVHGAGGWHGYAREQWAIMLAAAPDPAALSHGEGRK